MSADDVRILLTARKKFDTECHAQKEVDIVPQWSRQWNIQLNFGKGNDFAFKWNPTIKL